VCRKQSVKNGFDGAGKATRRLPTVATPSADAQPWMPNEPMMMG